MRRLLSLVVGCLVLTGCAGSREPASRAMIEHQAELASTIIYILNEDIETACVEAKPLLLATVAEYLDEWCPEQDTLRTRARGE